MYMYIQFKTASPQYCSRQLERSITYSIFVLFARNIVLLLLILAARGEIRHEEPLSDPLHSCLGSIIHVQTTTEAGRFSVRCLAQRKEDMSSRSYENALCPPTPPP